MFPAVTGFLLANIHTSVFNGHTLYDKIIDALDTFVNVKSTGVAVIDVSTHTNDYAGFVL